MGKLALKGPDRMRLRYSIEASFSVRELEEVVKQALPQIVNSIPWREPLSTVVSEVIDAASRHARLDVLAVALASERPYVEEFAAIVLTLSTDPGWTLLLQRHGFDVKGGLEALTSPTGGFTDTTRLARWLIRTERQVCRVWCGSELGTGFLVGPDLVLTCYHVVRLYLEKKVTADKVAVLFDYRRDEKGAAPVEDPTKWVGIDATWEVPSSPYAQADISLVGEPADDKLDYALLKLSREVGCETPDGESEARRWVDISMDRALPAQATPILIVQHPGVPNALPPAQHPLQITFDERGFVGATPSGNRVAYRPSTLPGSSGSPVCDRTLSAVALHHNRGQIDPAAAGLYTDNRGIPLAKIRSHLKPAIRGLLVAPT